MKTTKIRNIVRKIAGSMATVKNQKLDSGTSYVKVIVHSRQPDPVKRMLIEELKIAGYHFEQGHYSNEICALIK